MCKRRTLVAALVVCVIVGGCLNWQPSGSAVDNAADSPGGCNPVYGMTVSYGERWLAYHGLKKAIQLQELPRRRPAATLIYRNHEIQCIVFHPSEAILFACYVNGDAIRWMRRGGGWHPELIGTVNDEVTCCAVSSRGDCLAVGTCGGNVTVFTLGTKPRKARTLQHAGSVWSIGFSPDGSEMTVAGSSKTWTRWKVETWTATIEPTGHQDVVSQVAYTDDGSRLVSGGYDGILRMTDRATGRTLWKVDLGERGVRGLRGVRSIGFSTDGRVLAVGSVSSGKVQLRDAGSGRLLKVIAAHQSTVTQVRFLTDGTLLTSSHDGTVEAFHVELKQESD